MKSLQLEFRLHAGSTRGHGTCLRLRHVVDSSLHAQGCSRKGNRPTNYDRTQSEVAAASSSTQLRQFQQAEQGGIAYCSDGNEKSIVPGFVNGIPSNFSIQNHLALVELIGVDSSAFFISIDLICQELLLFVFALCLTKVVSSRRSTIISIKPDKSASTSSKVLVVLESTRRLAF